MVSLIGLLQTLKQNQGLTYINRTPLTSLMPLRSLGGANAPWQAVSQLELEFIVGVSGDELTRRCRKLPNSSGSSSKRNRCSSSVLYEGSWTRDMRSVSPFLPSLPSYFEPWTTMTTMTAPVLIALPRCMHHPSDLSHSRPQTHRHSYKKRSDLPSS